MGPWSSDAASDPIAVAQEDHQTTTNDAPLLPQPGPLLRTGPVGQNNDCRGTAFNNTLNAYAM
eukprot:688785-Pyramimonas_sp.AAC.1